jgi:hypothetical protein
MRRALCVGIDLYPFGSLAGCVSDAERVARVLAKNDDGTPNFDCRIITAPLGGKPDLVTRPILRQAIEQLFKDKADVALLHFSGHGTVNNLDGYLVTQDAESYDDGVSMTDVLKLANGSAAGEVVILLDCCHAGNFGNPPVIDNTKALLREGVSVLTASRGDQPSVEVGGGGLFTSLVVDALAGGAADILGGVTAPAVYAYVEAALGAWDQRPLFKAHVSKLVELRRCQCAIDPVILRKLPEYFPLPAEDLPLDPTFEATSATASPNNVRVFEALQKLNRVHLVEPVGAKHMSSRACHLTASGRYYWRLASNHRI